MSRGFICELDICSNPSNIRLYCTKCFKKFCKDDCLKKHINDSHNISNIKKILINEDQFEYNSEEATKFIELEDQYHTNRINISSISCFTTSMNDKFSFDYDNNIYKQNIFIKPGMIKHNYKQNEYYNINNFEFLKNEILGTGSFGEVFVGLHRKTNKKYAIKKVILKI